MPPPQAPSSPRLQPIADNLWSTTAPLRFLGVETGARMTVVKLHQGGLFIHSPLPLSAELRAELDALGRVSAIVAPSLFHHLFVADWQKSYPEVPIRCCPGLEKKRADFPWSGVLSDTPEPEWAGQLEQVWFSARSLENEVVFFHPNSATMICADALFHLASHPSRLTRTVATLLGNRHPGATWLERLLMRDRALARRQVDRMLAWKPKRILLAHGQCIEAEGEAVLRQAYSWL